MGERYDIQQYILQKINELYSQYYEETRKTVFDTAMQRMYNHTSWRIPKGYWGDGIGNYKFRVSNDVINEVQNQRIDSDLFDSRFENKFFEDIKSFLTIM